MFRTQAASETSAEQQIPPSTNRDAAASASAIQGSILFFRTLPQRPYREDDITYVWFLGGRCRSVPTCSKNQASLEARLIWLY